MGGKFAFHASFLSRTKQAVASDTGFGTGSTYSRYDGHQEVHTYWLNNTQTQMPFAGNAQGLTVSRQYNPATRTTTTTRTAAGNTLSKETNTYDPATNTSTSTVYSSATESLSTVTTNMPYTADFGGQPASILHPDTTLTTYSYERHSDGGKTVIMKNGAASGNAVSLGKSTTTTYNRYGTVIRSITETIGYTDNMPLDHTAVTSVDNFGRPLVTAAFPTVSSAVDGAVQATATAPKWSTSMTYSCCGTASTTDRTGITTTYAYDSLRRQNKSTSLGVTQETVHRGLTQDTHRYPEGGSASTANLISSSSSNLAGTQSSSRSPDPTSTTAGALVETTTAITYQPATGLSTRTVTTTPDLFSQTTDSLLDGRTAATSGDLSPAMTCSYSANATGEISRQAYLVGTNYYEATASQSDWAGRSVQSGSLTPGTGLISELASSTLGASVSFFYNSLGQMVKSTDPDIVVSLYAYNNLGEQAVTAIDLNVNGLIDYGIDTVSSSRAAPDTGTIAGTTGPVWKTISKVWQDGDTNPTAGTIVSTSLRSTDGLSSSSQSIGSAPPSTSLTLLNTAGAWTEKSTSPGGAYTRTTYLGGLMDISESFDSNNVLISSTAMRDSSNDPLSGYDFLNRPTHQRDSRTGVTNTEYRSDTADFVVKVNDPGNRDTSFDYDVRGRRITVDAPNSFDPAGAPNNTDFANVTTTHYFPDGNVQETTGDQTYRTTHTYDYADRQKTMTTYGGTTATTTWNYDPQRGFMTRKEYSDGKGTDYLYTDAGRLFTRTWQRGVVTTYGYDDGGRLETVTYANEPVGNTTPNLAYTYDALGRIDTVTRGGQLHADYTYNASDLVLLTERLQIDSLDKTITRTYEDGTSGTVNLRPNGYSFANGSATWTYDAAGRPSTLGDGTDAFTYSYRYTINGGGNHEGVTTGGTQSTMPFHLDGPKVDTTLEYDPTRGLLLARVNAYPAGTLSAFAYGVNALGQRDSLTTSGDAFSSAPAWSWGYNSRGELVQADDTSTAGNDRAYEYDGIGNRKKSVEGLLTSLPTTDNYAANALNQYTTVAAYTPAPVYDEDGNLTSGPVPGAAGLSPGIPAPSSASIKWDAENRLVEATVNSITVTYDYDYLGRLTKRTEGSTAAQYLYDGWNRIAEYAGSSSPTHLTSYLWGLDLSQSTQGAGGVGGLLSVVATGGTTRYYPAYDGNGNVSEYVNQSGMEVAHFEYDPFGNLTVDDQSNAESFPYRFSTKPQDHVTGLDYYGYRYYDPMTGRWPSRDPIGEKGGVNLYGFVGNDGINQADLLGMDCIAITDRIAVSWPFYHYAVEKITGCCPEQGKEEDYSEALGDDASSAAKVELLNIQGFTADHYGSYRSRFGHPSRRRSRLEWRRVALSPNGISFVHYDVYESESRKFINIFDGDSEEVDQKWASITAQAGSYQYAEQAPAGSRIAANQVSSFSNFPYSLYDAFGNNSNTFVRHVVTSAGLQMSEISGSHPGNNQPDSNNFDWSKWKNPQAGW
jgi:RHS repeat-associated protein